MSLDREKKLWHEQMVVWHRQNIVACNQQIEYLKVSIEANKRFISSQIKSIGGNGINSTLSGTSRTERMSLLDKMIITQESLIKWHSRQIEFHTSIVKW